MHRDPVGMSVSCLTSRTKSAPCEPDFDVEQRGMRGYVLTIDDLRTLCQHSARGRYWRRLRVHERGPPAWWRGHRRRIPEACRRYGQSRSSPTVRERHGANRPERTGLLRPALRLRHARCRAWSVALVVGRILVVINHGDVLLSGQG